MTTRPVLTSIHGRRVGLDRDGYLVVDKGFREKTTAITTSVNVSDSGVAVHSSTGAQAFTLDAPRPGVEKHIILNSTSTSTAARTVTLASGNFQSTASSTYTILTFNAAAQSVSLVGISTARYQVMANNGVTLS